MAALAALAACIHRYLPGCSPVRLLVIWLTGRPLPRCPRRGLRPQQRRRLGRGTRVASARSSVRMSHVRVCVCVSCCELSASRYSILAIAVVAATAAAIATVALRRHNLPLHTRQKRGSFHLAATTSAKPQRSPAPHLQKCLVNCQEHKSVPPLPIFASVA